jgi:hypothetical protein
MANYVTNLDAATPTSVDPIAEGAEEIRLVKEALKNTFPLANSPLRVSNDAIEILINETIGDMAEEIASLTRRLEALEGA